MYKGYIHIWTFVAITSTTTPTMNKFGHLHTLTQCTWNYVDTKCNSNIQSGQLNSHILI
jgi:hypothetical protein